MKLFLTVLTCLIILGCNDDDAQPQPTTGPARVSGTVVNTAGIPVAGVRFHTVYGYRELELELGTPTGFVMRSHGRTYLSLTTDSQVLIILTDRLRDDFRVTMVDGEFAAGAHEIDINLASEPNGVYDLSVYWHPNGRFPDDSAHKVILKNETVLEELAQALPSAISGANGRFDFPVNAHDSIITSAGTYGLIIDRVRLYAMTDDSPPAHTLLSITPGSRNTWNPIVQLANDDNVYIQDGDTLYLIPDSARALADLGYVNDAYLLREYQVAIDPNYNTTPYEGLLADWGNEPWDQRSQYLPPPYSDNILGLSDGERYWLITTRMEQLGYGWNDTYPTDADLNRDIEWIWGEPSDPSNTPDDPNTIGFDGTSNLRNRFRSMWIPVE
jgi:hypothetical protein